MIVLNNQQSLALGPPTWIAFEPLLIQPAHDVAPTHRILSWLIHMGASR